MLAPLSLNDINNYLNFKRNVNKHDSMYSYDHRAIIIYRKFEPFIREPETVAL